MPIDSQAFAVLVELRERVAAALPTRASGHVIEPAESDVLRPEGGVVWIWLRHRTPEGDGHEGRLALMPESVLRRPDEARMRVSVWLEIVASVFGPGREAPPSRPRLGLLEVRAVARAKRFATADALREAYGCDPRLGPWLPLPPCRTVDGESAVEVVERVLAEHRPFGSSRAQLEPVPHGDEERMVIEARAGRGIEVVLRLILWDEDDERRSIRDIKEQPVRLLPAHAFYRVERVEACLRGWAAALRATLAGVALERVETAMPDDLVYPEVLALATPRTVEQFRDAFAVRSRLGRFSSSGDDGRRRDGQQAR